MASSEPKKEKRVAVIQSNYIPWRGYFSIINDVDLFIFYDEVKYTKNTWRNRNQIIGPNGPYWLTIPIASHYVHHKISDVSIDTQDWKIKHEKSVRQSYKKASFFYQLEEFLELIYLQNQWKNLSDLNHTSIKMLSRLLGCKTEFASSSDFKLKEGRIDRLFHLLLDAGATHYIAGPSSHFYLEEQRKKFEDAGIGISYKSYDHLKPYSQLSDQFHGAVSVLDLIANVDQKEIRNYL